MPIQTIIANVTSPGEVNLAVIRLESEMRAMEGTPEDRSATVDVDVVGDLDIIFVCNALFGTRWKLTLSLEGGEPFFMRSGKTDTKNSSLVVESVPLP